MRRGARSIAEPDRRRWPAGAEGRSPSSSDGRFTRSVPDDFCDDSCRRCREGAAGVPLSTMVSDGSGGESKGECVNDDDDDEVVVEELE